MSDRSPRFRSVLDQCPTYKPGKKVVSPDGKCHKLASNESPFGPLPSVAKAIAAAAGEVNWYPDNTAVELTEAIARRHDVPPAHIAVGCGSVGSCPGDACSGEGGSDPRCAEELIGAGFWPPGRHRRSGV